MYTKDHDLLDAKAYALSFVTQEINRYKRRMTDVAFQSVKDQMQTAITEGKAPDANEIGRIALQAAKAQVVADSRAALPAKPRRARITKG